MMLSKNPKSVVAIFAHPDDEAFGPAGTLAKLAREDDVYVLCATRGEAGGDHKRIAQIRSKELLLSAKIIGVKKVYFLGFVDGKLCNSDYQRLAKRIERKLKVWRPQTLVTFEPRGISGHIDHIVVSMVTTYVFNKLPYVKTLLYHCLSEEDRKEIRDYFIYFPPGYRRNEIDKVVNVADVWDIKVKAMMAHKSQYDDARRILKMREKLPKEEYFLVLSRE